MNTFTLFFASLVMASAFVIGEVNDNDVEIYPTAPVRDAEDTGNIPPPEPVPTSTRRVGEETTCLSCN